MVVLNVQPRWCDLKVLPTNSATGGRFSVPWSLVAPTLWLWIEFEVLGDLDLETAVTGRGVMVLN